MAKIEALPRHIKGRIRLDVVTPDGLALSEAVDELTAPSVEGEFGVLPGHLPLLAALRTGLVSYRKAAETTTCAVGPGFVEVADDYAVLLTDRFMKKDAVDVVRTRLAFKEVQEKLAVWGRDPATPEHQQLIAEELWHAVLLELYGDPPPPTTRIYDDVGQKKPEELPPAEESAPKMLEKN